MSSDVVEKLLAVDRDERVAAVERWWAGRSDAEAAARELADGLAALTNVPFKAPGSSADTALLEFLNVEGMRFPLDAAGEAAGDAEVAAQLWAHASTSALLMGELADLPYEYARRAILTGSLHPAVWEAFQSSLYGYSSGFLEDIEEWKLRAMDGELRQETVTRALAAASQCARDWDDEDRERLAEISG